MPEAFYGVVQSQHNRATKPVFFITVTHFMPYLDSLSLIILVHYSMLYLVTQET